MSKPAEEPPQLPTVKKACHELTTGDFLVVGNCACPVVCVYRVRTDVLAFTTAPGPKDKHHTDAVVISYRLKPGGETCATWRCEYGKPVDVLAASDDAPF